MQRVGTQTWQQRVDKVSQTARPVYAGSTAMDFDRLLSRTCSVVNSPPHTLQRQPGEEKAAIPVSC